MQRSIERSFRNNSLTPGSELIDVKHIGPYLYTRMRQQFAAGAATLTIRRFAGRIQNMGIDNLKKKLHTALQNARNNQCIRTPNRALYHVQDYNQKGYEAMINLIKVLARNGDGHNLGRNFRFDATRLRMPAMRNDDSKSCLSRAACRQNNGIWHDNLCQPPRNARGFAGVFPRSGQKTIRQRDRSQPLGSHRNSIRRGRYARAPNSQTLWRRPGVMRKV